MPSFSYLRISLGQFLTLRSLEGSSLHICTWIIMLSQLGLLQCCNGDRLSVLDHFIAAIHSTFPQVQQRHFCHHTKHSPSSSLSTQHRWIFLSSHTASDQPHPFQLLDSCEIFFVMLEHMIKVNAMVSFVSDKSFHVCPKYQIHPINSTQCFPWQMMSGLQKTMRFCVFKHQSKVEMSEEHTVSFWNIFLKAFGFTKLKKRVVIFYGASYLKTEAYYFFFNVLSKRHELRVQLEFPPLPVVFDISSVPVFNTWANLRQGHSEYFLTIYLIL